MKSSAKTERAAYRRLASSDIGILFGRRSSSRGKLDPPLHVRFGSEADIAAPPTHVRFTPKSGHRNCALLCADGSQLPVWREIPEHGSDQQERRHVANQMAYLLSVIHGLCCHDAGVRDAGPDGE